MCSSDLIETNKLLYKECSVFNFLCTLSILYFVFDGGFKEPVGVNYFSSVASVSKSCLQLMLVVPILQTSLLFVWPDRNSVVHELRNLRYLAEFGARITLLVACILDLTSASHVQDYRSMLAH